MPTKRVICPQIMEALFCLILIHCVYASRYFSYDTVTTPRPTPPYKFISKEQTYTVLEGDDVTLKCATDKPDKLFGAQWLNDTMPISFDRKLIGMWNMDTRASIGGHANEFNLQIRGVELLDEGDYTCCLFGEWPLKQRSSLIVNVPPSLRLRPSEEILTVEAGADVEVICDATGKPQPQITWARNGGATFSNQDTTVISGGRLRLTEVDRTFSGEYECQASNGAGSPVSEIITLQVQYNPEVETEEQIVQTGPGDKVEIRCVFYSNPKVESVTWMHNGTEFVPWRRNNFVARHRIDGDEQTWFLMVSPVRPSDLGIYSCSGKNARGSARSQVLLSALPHGLVFSSPEDAKYSDQYTLQWSVSSHSTLLDFFMLVHEIATSGEKILFGNNTIPAVQASSSLHPQSYILEDLLPNRTYSIKLRARNTFGHSDWSKEFLFHTPTGALPAPRSTSLAEDKRSDADSNDVNYLSTSANLHDRVNSAGLVSPTYLLLLTLFALANLLV